MGFMDNLRRGLERSRETLSEIFYMGGEVTEDFWDDLPRWKVINDALGASRNVQVVEQVLRGRVGFYRLRNAQLQGVGTPDQRIRVTFSGIENDYVYPKEAARPDHLGNTASLGKGSAILACGVIQVEYPRENIPGAYSYYLGSTVYRHRYLTAYDDLAIHTSSGNSSVTDADPDNDTDIPKY